MAPGVGQRPERRSGSLRRSYVRAQTCVFSESVCVCPPRGAKLSGARREGTPAYLNFTGISDDRLSFFLQGGLVRDRDKRWSVSAVG